MFNELKEDVIVQLKEIEKEYKVQLSKFRTSRASISLLDGIQVEYYGTQTPLNQLATLSVPDASCLQVQPWDVKSIEAIEKAIQTSDIGLNPVSDGRLIKIPIPPLSEERRQDIIKKLHRYTEERRTAIRNVRRDFRDMVREMENEKEISEDEAQRYYKELQTIIDRAMEGIETMAREKEKHILED
jgi:ribosome recycling factor